MATSGMQRAALITGLGAWLPSRSVPNDELCDALDTTDEWIRTRTGIRHRYFAEPGTSTSDLATEAGRLALKSAEESSVDAVVLATSTPDHTCPATAPTVAARLGLGTVAAYDVAAVCSGFIYGLANAAGLILSGVAERVLLIGADTFTTIVNPADRTTAVIFGDGAGAVLLRAGHAYEPGALLAFDLGSDGDQADLFETPAGGSKQRSAGTPAAPEDHYVVMNGRKLYKQAIRRMSESCRTVLDRTGWRVSDVDSMVPHQANARITAGVAENLDLPDGCGFSNVDRMGNTAAASLPIALADACASRALRPGNRTLLTAFGAGLTWGSATLVWPAITPYTNLTHP